MPPRLSSSRVKAWCWQCVTPGEARLRAERQKKILCLLPSYRSSNHAKQHCWAGTSADNVCQGPWTEVPNVPDCSSTAMLATFDYPAARWSAGFWNPVCLCDPSPASLVLASYKTHASRQQLLPAITVSVQGAAASGNSIEPSHSSHTVGRAAVLHGSSEENAAWSWDSSQWCLQETHLQSSVLHEAPWPTQHQ